MAFPVVMYGCERWTIKKAEYQRTDAFELWYWRRLLRIPWTARRFNQPILKEVSPGCSLEGLMLELKIQLLWSPDVKNWLIGKDPDAGKDWRHKKEVTEDKTVEWHHWLNGHEFEKTSRDSEGQESLVCCSLWGRKESNPTEWLNNKNNSDISLENSECMSWVSCVWLFVAPWTI